MQSPQHAMRRRSTAQRQRRRDSTGRTPVSASPHTTMPVSIPRTIPKFNRPFDKVPDSARSQQSSVSDISHMTSAPSSDLFGDAANTSLLHARVLTPADPGAHDLCASEFSSPLSPQPAEKTEHAWPQARFSTEEKALQPDADSPALSPAGPRRLLHVCAQLFPVRLVHMQNTYVLIWAYCMCGSFTTCLRGCVFAGLRR